MTISGNDLLELGYKPGQTLGRALGYARRRIEDGSAWTIVREEILEKFPCEEPPKVTLRDSPLNVSCAGRAENEEEELNLQGSLEKIRELSRVPVVERVALMPDNCPSGGEWGCIPVGGALATKHHVLPSAHSADINCGMCASFFLPSSGGREMARVLKDSCFFGPWAAKESDRVDHPVLHEGVWSNPFLSGLEDSARNYLGTQGDGNHFSYLGRFVVKGAFLKTLDTKGHYELAEKLHGYDEDELAVLVTHHGSRQLGAKVYKRGMEFAERETGKVASAIPKSGCWIDIRTPEGKLYWEALEYVGRWTQANHRVVHQRFLHKIGVEPIARVENHHNAVWMNEGMVYHGKGATPAWSTDGVPLLGIIPLNMGREILLVSGSDNKDFLSFAPHGAGRNKSRTAMKREFLDPVTQKLDPDRVRLAISEAVGDLPVYWASGRPDVSESPIGYKPASKIKRELQEFGLAELMGEIHPSGCVMAGEFDRVDYRALRRAKQLSRPQAEKKIHK